MNCYLLLQMKLMFIKNNIKINDIFDIKIYKTDISKTDSDKTNKFDSCKFDKLNSGDTD